MCSASAGSDAGLLTSCRKEACPAAAEIQLIAACPNKAGAASPSATKTFARTDGRWSLIASYDKTARNWRPLAPLRISCPREIAPALQEVDSSTCMVLGAPNLEDRRVVARLEAQESLTRTKLEKAEKSQLPCFTEVPRQIFMIDFDPKAAELFWMRELGIDIFSDPDRAARLIADKFLPKDIASASLVWQLSSGAGISASGEFDPALAKIHFFFMTKTPLMPADVKALIAKRAAFNDACGYSLKALDLSLYQGVQPHYIAAPRFVGGADPLPRRWGMLPGDVERAALAVKFDEASGTPSHSTSSAARVLKGPNTHLRLDGKAKPDYPRDWRAIIRLLGDGDERRGFHEPLLAATASLKRELSTDGVLHAGLSQSEIATLAEPYLSEIRRAIASAPSAHRSASERKRYADDVWRYFIEAPAPRAAEQREVEPLFRDESLPLSIAGERLKGSIAAFGLAATEYHEAVAKQAQARNGWEAAGRPSTAGGTRLPYPIYLPPVRDHVIAAETGLGKTRGVLEWLLRNVDFAYWRTYVLVDNHEKADELRDEIAQLCNALGVTQPPDAVVYRGRSREFTDKAGALVKMCNAPSEVQRVAARAEKLGLSPRDAACKICPNRKACPWLAQFRDTTPGLKIVPKAYLRHDTVPGIPRTEKERAQQQRDGAAPIFAVVIDESFADSLLFEGRVKLSEIASSAVPQFAAGLPPAARERAKKDLQRIVRLVRAAARQADLRGLVPVGAFSDVFSCDLHNETRKTNLEKWSGLLDAIIPSIERRIAQALLEGQKDFGALSQSRNVLRWLKGLFRLLREAPRGRRELYGLEVSGDFLSLSWQRRLPGWLRRYPTLLLDATGDEELTAIPYAQFDNRLVEALPVFTRIRAKAEHATLVKVVNAPTSKKKLGLLDNDSEGRFRGDSNAETVLRVANAVLGRVSASGGSTGFISHKALVSYAKRNKCIDPSCATMYFGNMRGLNGFANTAALVVAGSYLMAPAELARRARAVYALDPQGRSVEPGHEPQPRERGLRCRKGQYAVGVPVLTREHPCEHTQRVLAQMCVAEEEQALGRARATRRTSVTPVLIVSINNVVTDTTYDQVLDWAALASLSAEDAALYAYGVVPHKAAHCRKLAPHLWPGAEAAKKQTARARRLTAPKTGQGPIVGFSIGASPVFGAKCLRYLRGPAPEPREAIVLLKSANRHQTEAPATLDTLRADEGAQALATALGKALVGWRWADQPMAPEALKMRRSRCKAGQLQQPRSERRTPSAAGAPTSGAPATAGA